MSEQPAGATDVRTWGTCTVADDDGSHKVKRIVATRRRSGDHWAAQGDHRAAQGRAGRHGGGGDGRPGRGGPDPRCAGRTGRRVPVARRAGPDRRARRRHHDHDRAGDHLGALDHHRATHDHHDLDGAGHHLQPPGPNHDDHRAGDHDHHDDPQANTSSKTPWPLIVVIIVLVLAIVLVVVLMRSRRRKALEAEWRRAVVPALSDAQLARESLSSGNAVSDDPELRGAVSVQVERAAAALDGAARKAPDPQAGSMATTAAGALRGLAFAVEADRLLRHGASAPTGVQLAQADEARRARTTELNTALARLSTRIGVPPGTSSRR